MYTDEFGLPTSNIKESLEFFLDKDYKNTNLEQNNIIEEQNILNEENTKTNINIEKPKSLIKTFFKKK